MNILLTDPVDEPPRPALTCADWDALPISTRIADRLSFILQLASEIAVELQTEEGATLRWIAPAIEHVLERTDANLNRLAS